MLLINKMINRALFILLKKAKVRIAKPNATLIIEHYSFNFEEK